MAKAQSRSDAAREYAMEERYREKKSGYKKPGPKARAQRITARQVGKTIKNQDKAMSKRGGTKPVTAADKRRASLKKQEAAAAKRGGSMPRKFPKIGDYVGRATYSPNRRRTGGRGSSVM